MPVLADNCGSLSDCFASNLLPALLVVLGLVAIVAIGWYAWPLLLRLAAGSALRALIAAAGRSRIAAGLARTLGRLGPRAAGRNPFVTRAGTLRGWGRAVADTRKFTDYALNPAHPVGGNKARVFERALGYNRSNWQGLRDQILRGLRQARVQPGTVDQYGTRFTADILVKGPNGSTATVRTAWIYRPGSNVPELTTLFIP